MAQCIYQLLPISAAVHKGQSESRSKELLRSRGVIVTSNLSRRGADLIERHNQISPRIQVSFVLLSQYLTNLQALLVGIQRLRELALRHQHIAYIVVTDRENSLPVRVSFVLLGQ